MSDEMDKIRDLIRRLIAEKNLKMSHVSNDIGHADAYLEQFLRRGVPKELGEDERKALATILGVPESKLRPTRQAPNVRQAPSPTILRNGLRDIRDIPVWRSTAEGLSGAFLVHYGEPVNQAKRLSGIENATGIYALYVVGQSMYPAYRAGQLIYVSENKPPSIGCDVIIQCLGELDKIVRCYLKRLIRRPEGLIVCEQFNPPQESTFNEAEVVGMHRVLTLEELVEA